ncbi:hypothetical protein [Sphingobium sp. KCTC 72723]|uniref:hypothetical protein n=1 Tax=Sphingobium sp. KCTC 72723 TaxID=2733867 RepID=UPI00165E0B49|nr:hypothetical protein [Sphingobium sp. KCTC 72723]
MLSDVRSLMTDTVEHWLPPARNITGTETKAGSTIHAARVTYSPGRIVGPASREKASDAAATIWLLNHPRAAGVGDTFTLPNGETLKAVRVEHRSTGADTITKVYLS